MTETAIVVALVAMSLVSFWLGFTGSTRIERNTAEFLRSQQASINQWVQKNWPDKNRAYINGHKEGYQQGITHSPELENGAE